MSCTRFTLSLLFTVILCAVYHHDELEAACLMPTVSTTATTIITTTMTTTETTSSSIPLCVYAIMQYVFSFVHS